MMIVALPSLLSLPPLPRRLELAPPNAAPVSFGLILFG
jgi:hypothetical protein